MSKQVKLTKNKTTLVDDEDYKKVIALAPWYVLKGGYAARSNYIKGTGTSKMVYLHRFLLDAQKGQFVDHVNGDRLDNRKSNIRLCSIEENNRNTRKRKNSKSKYKGVFYVKNNTYRKWEACLSVNKQRIHCGYYENEESAAKAYDFYAKTFYKTFANLNFKESECLLNYKPTTNKTDKCLNNFLLLSPDPQSLKERVEMAEPFRTLQGTTSLND